MARGTGLTLCTRPMGRFRRTRASARKHEPPQLPGQRVAKRNARKEKLVKCVLAPRRGRHHPARDGSRRNRRRLKRARRQGKIGAGTDTPTPVQQLCTHVQSCDQKRFFLFHRARRILFLSRTKREWGAHPRGNGPLREQTPPWPPFGGPPFPPCISPLFFK